MAKFKQVMFAAILMLVAAHSNAAPIDINTADAEAIASAMKGIGVKKAEAIVAYRNTNGAFKDVSDLALVKGISDKTIDKNREKITINK